MNDAASAPNVGLIVGLCLIAISLLVALLLKLFRRLSPLRALAEAYPCQSPSPANTRLFAACVGYVGSATIHAGSSQYGLYLVDSLFHPDAVCIPWAVLGNGRRFGPLTLFWLKEFRVPLIVASSLLLRRPSAEAER